MAGGEGHRSHAADSNRSVDPYALGRCGTRAPGYRFLGHVGTSIYVCIDDDIISVCVYGSGYILIM